MKGLRQRRPDGFGRFKTGLEGVNLDSFWTVASHREDSPGIERNSQGSNGGNSPPSSLS
jgi:hypothetical protein